MQAFMTAKVRPFLVISSVLAVWLLLAAQPAQTHTTTLPSPTCSSLPDDEFFTSSADIISTAPTPTITTQQGVGSTTRERLRYGKITIPALAAGELRVFSTTSPSDAVLCRGGSTRASSRTSYTAHNSAENAAAAADRAAANTTISEASAKSALRSAAAALTAVANALAAAGHTTEAAQARNDAATATGIANADADQNASDEISALGDAADDLEIAAAVFHTGFQIRAEVRPGDEAYVLVVAVVDVTAAPTVAIQFHGAIEEGAATARQGLEGFLDAGEVESRSIVITAPGLLTLETTGSTDTVGMFGASTEMFESGGSGGNFKMAVPVENSATAQTLTVEGQTPTTTGAYTLDMDFQVAQDGATAAPTQITVTDVPDWTGTGIPTDDTMLQIDGSTDADYFVFDSSAIGLVTVEATNASGTTSHADTAGTLYGPTGQIATATSGNGNHFRFRVPVDTQPYLVEVTGTTGMYDLRFAFQTATAQAASATTPAADDSVTCPGTPADPDATAANLICPSASTGQQERDRYQIDIMESGTLYVHTTGNTDTRGVLYGPDGRQLGEDDNSGQGTNFSIAVSVNPGLHIVEVRGQNRRTTGAYGLVTSFIAGAGPVDPTDPTDPTPPATDATGALDDPPNGGSRSGIGLIRGWVCQARSVQVAITGPSEGTARLVQTISTPYGSVREPEAVARCRHTSPNIGFAAQFNYNLLEEGTYTAEARADGQPIATNTFTVVRISDDVFLEDASSGEVRVEDFPFTGDSTILEWDEASQNFQIVDHQ